MEHLLSALTFAARGPGWPILLVGILALIPTSAAAQYKLQPGDALEISVAGVPDFRQRSPIAIDGEIDVPLVGQIHISGLSVAEARARIKRELSNKVYRQPTIDGREVPRLILPDAIAVTPVEYRPIYVNGDVARPGEYTFRPGLTVRQAVAIAGGYDLAQFRMANPFLQAADFRSEYEALWSEFAREQARIWRLRTELGEQGLEYTANKAPISADFGERLMQAETEHLKARMADREKDKALLQEAMNKASLQLNVLAQKKKHDEEGNKADMEDFQKVRDLFQRGMTASTRLSEARRAALLSSDQLLQTIIATSNVEQQRGEFARQREKVDSQSRIEAWRELQEANLRIAQITARIRNAGEKLVHVGLLQSQLEQGTAGGRPHITVHRKSGNGPERLTANENIELAPGDVVDVKLESESSSEAALKGNR